IIGDIPEPPKLPLGLQLAVKTAAAAAAAVAATDTCPPTDELVGASAAAAAAVAAVAAGVPCPTPPSRDRPSIARLLSVSSGKTDSSLPEVTSGYCGHGDNAIAGVKCLAPPTHSNHAGPALPGAPVGTDERSQLVPLRKCAVPSLAGAETVRNRIDYSDLASILMDGGFDACKVLHAGVVVK
ncbi:unnamed protein product, partial [Ectocarpus sp. 12 AP-2014]